MAAIRAEERIVGLGCNQYAEPAMNPPTALWCHVSDPHRIASIQRVTFGIIKNEKQGIKTQNIKKSG